MMRIELPMSKAISGVTETPLPPLTMLAELATRVPLSVELETKYRQMAEASPLMIWLAGEDGQATYFNQALLNFFGTSLPEMHGAGWSKFVHAADVKMVLQQYLTALYARQPFALEFRMLRFPAETEVQIQSVGMPRYAPNGTFSGFIGFLFDRSPHGD